MRNYQGKPLNIASSVLGKITWKKRDILSRRNYLYVTDTLDKNHWLYEGILTSERNIKATVIGRIPCIFNLKQNGLEALQEGDIAILEPNGNINVVWEVNSPHNSILATEDCNCSCIMCPQPRREDPEGLTEFNLKLIRLINPKITNEIGITGGEPTLLGKDLIRLVSACKKHLPRASVTLLTNGRKFSCLDFAKELIKVGHPDLLICIPLYSDNDKEHDRIVGAKGSFFETLKGIKNLALLRQKIEIRNVIHALTYKRLPQFAEFIYHNFPFVIHIALMGIETVGLAKKNLETLWIDPINYMPQLRDATIYLHRRNLNVSIYNLQLCILPKELWGFSKKSISDWKNIYLQECKNCNVLDQCCGFFGTSDGCHSSYIHSFRNNYSFKKSC